MKNNIIIGLIVGVLSFILIVYCIESNKSISQFLLGFFAFIIPTLFFSSFQSNTGSFLIVLYILFSLYGIYKFEYYDTIYGVLLAIIIGSPIAYYRIGKYELFDSKTYKNHMDKNN